ncbi:MAG: NADP-dependent malic enzyme [bacterium]
MPLSPLQLHKKLKGKFTITPKMDVKDKHTLALLYTPGVAEPCKEIANNKEMSFKLTGRANALAVITDGSAVLGLGNIGAEAAMPVMEGKAILFKKLGGIDAYPICLKTQNKDEIINIIKNLAPTFGAINIEDIAAPKCFEIEDSLQDLGIPVMHDDQHATAIVASAGLINALKVAGKNLREIKIVLSGAGAAGIAIAKMILRLTDKDTKGRENLSDMIVCDTKGIIHKGRPGLKENIYKKELAKITNKNNISGTLEDAFKGADVFIGVSKGGIVKKEWIKKMNTRPIIFALANPIPEIMPEEAKLGGAFIIATGRSDYHNQLNNVLAFPGVFRGALNARARAITEEMQMAAVYALANFIKIPRKNYIIPDALNPKVHKIVAKEVMKTAI